MLRFNRTRENSQTNRDLNIHTQADKYTPIVKNDFSSSKKVPIVAVGGIDVGSVARTVGNSSVTFHITLAQNRQTALHHTDDVTVETRKYR